MSTVADLPGVFGTDWGYLLKPSMTLDADTQGYVSTLTFYCILPNLSSFVLTVGGSSQVITASWGTFNRVVPMQHPYFSGLWARRVQCEAFGTASTTSSALADAWSHARVKVEFGSLTYGITGDTAYSEWEIDQGSTYTTFPGRQFKFPSGEPIDQDAGAWATTNSYSLTLYQCPTINDSVIDSISGTVNNAVFMGKPVGQLLFGGCRSVYKTNVGGVVTYNKTLSFNYRGYPWNQVFKKDGTLDTPLDPAGNPQYASSTFSNLFG